MKIKLKKKKHTKRKLPYKALIELQNALDAYKEKDYLEALEVLEKLDGEYPNRVEILGELFNVYAQLKDYNGYMYAAEKLLKLEGPSEEVLFGLANMYMMNMRIALGVKTFQEFLKRYPENEFADDAQEKLELLSKELEKMLAEIDLDGDVEFAEKHEEVQCLMERNEYEKGIALAHELLEERPDFVAVRNNLSMMLDLSGRTEEAIEQAKEVLKIKPENAHALSNLTQFLLLEGRMDEVKETAEKLKALQVKEFDHFLKKAEALSKLGDDEGVRTVWREANEAGVTDFSGAAYLYHLAAVAFMHSNDAAEAIRLWKKAIEFQPDLTVAKENLHNAALPIGERDAAWAFHLGYWFRSRKFKELYKKLEAARGRLSDERIKQIHIEFLDEHPEIINLMLVLLDRGDPKAKEFVLKLVDLSRMPELLEIARDFALSQHGADKWRHNAAQMVVEEGLLPKDKLRMWVRGEWQEVSFIETSINDEPSCFHEPEVEELIEKGIDAMSEEEYELAEEFFKKALALDAKSPMIKQNIAAAIHAQGKSEEAIALIREVHKEHPDYVFAITTLVKEALKQNNIDEAAELLKPLYTRPHFHFSEYDAFAEAQIELHIARKDTRSARIVLQNWAGMNDEVDVNYWEMRLMNKDNILKKLLGFGKKF